MYTRINIEFNSNDLILRGWLYIPQQQHHTKPCVIMTHGFGALKEHYLDKFAARFAELGCVVLVYDNRHFGDSDGMPRFEVDPQAQITDMQNAITFVQQLPEVNPEKIALWGTSFSGGVVINTAAIEKRIACVVTQVPFVDGQFTTLRSTKPESWKKLARKFTADTNARAKGKAPAMIPVVTANPEKPAVIKQTDAYAFFTSVDKWKNAVTLKSVANAGEFAPVTVIAKVSAPLLFIVAKNDTVNLTDLALHAYAIAPDPKKLVLIAGDHFAAYKQAFAECVTAAIDWFTLYLMT